MRARLILEDGTIYEGTGFGAQGESFGEIVFNTGMTGYQEILTDPSYYGQIVTMTYPLIGNYGVNVDDTESSKPHAFGFVVREAADHPSNWRNMGRLSEYLERNGIIGISGVDTRSLVKKIRQKGTMRAVLTTLDTPLENLQAILRASLPVDQVARVTTPIVYRCPGEGPRIVAMDFGMKAGVLRSLLTRGCDVTVVPAHTSAEEIFAMKPHGVMLSNGPGDPAELPHIVETVRELLGRVPIFGICMGHQLLSLACGAKTKKLKFGHHGANHPVKDLLTGRVYITSQNHEYEVMKESLAGTDLELTHLNQNDGTVEGVRHKFHPAFSVQYHPEARPGPDDSDYLFDRFMDMIEQFQEIVAYGGRRS
ncbi:glutamine-hydrolyzing carbamoyl-phosphate synthase small subunit [Effusibacillus lacus]|uniref:Carbamoyl phosphate synthase small chain n=1 Tax=Effusibacillus lacus TaxID=1348429 RepID=A0A292YR43_9BACL|nr:glutamine-hydrolyzing carbamoyl-phosphate synthase small subunit [Effusibacillus lacus]TCS75643.1 carbamoyl-phosphate synthase small subunit [Effusibacillus lacus]GAX90965.1 carbamoyl phosphate synthase small subunit [Effusibacillus lacus]